jgi:hypothetical protein
MVWMYDAYLHSMLEADKALTGAASALNNIKFERLPVTHFEPSRQVTEIYNGIVFEKINDDNPVLMAIPSPKGEEKGERGERKGINFFYFNV